MPSVNSDIRDMVLQHAHYLESYKATEVRTIRTFLRQADKRIAETLNNSGITTWTRERFNTLQSTLHQVEAATARGFRQELLSSARSLGEIEAKAITQIVDKAAGNVINVSTFTFRTPSPEVIWAAATSRPLLLNGNVATLLEPFISGMSQTRLRAIDSSLRYSFSVGETIDQARYRMLGTGTRSGALNMSRNSAEAITRTTMNHLSSVARHQTYTQNESLIRGYQWISTLDLRTSDICQDFDGKVWIFKEEDIETGDSLLPNEQYPPAHPNCRSSTAPITRSWKALGIDANELPESTRASMNGQVPESTTYYDWLGRQSAGVQRDVLGATRYNMYTKGVAMTEFHAVDGRLMTLDTLRSRGYTVPPLAEVMRRKG